jgi:hypothetical protein
MLIPVMRGHQRLHFHIEALSEKNPVAKEILDLQQYLIKKSVDIRRHGWAYDIGYGGLTMVGFGRK